MKNDKAASPGENLFEPGLVSVTFRKLEPDAIIRLVRQAGLACIEWGGDVHVPHGNIARAESVRKATEEAGLRIAGYGSYYRLGASRKEGLDFSRVIETALALGSSSIRIWAGGVPSNVVEAEARRTLTEELQAMADAAAKFKLTVATEYHKNTLTDDCASGIRLLRETNRPNLRTYWQPVLGQSVADGLNDLDRLLPYLSDLHVYHWSGTPLRKYPLADGEEPWRAYLLKTKPPSASRPRRALLEFVEDDSPEAFLRDALTLKAMIRAV